MDHRILRHAVDISEHVCFPDVPALFWGGHSSAMHSNHVDENLYTPVFLLSIVGPDYCVPL